MLSCVFVTSSFLDSTVIVRMPVRKSTIEGHEDTSVYKGREKSVLLWLFPSPSRGSRVSISRHPDLEVGTRGLWSGIWRTRSRGLRPVLNIEFGLDLRKSYSPKRYTTKTGTLKVVLGPTRHYDRSHSGKWDSPTSWRGSLLPQFTDRDRSESCCFYKKVGSDSTCNTCLSPFVVYDLLEERGEDGR